MPQDLDAYRSNIILRVTICAEDDRYARLLQRLKERPPGATLLFTNRLADCKTLRTFLKKHGILAYILSPDSNNTSRTTDVLGWFEEAEAPVVLLRMHESLAIMRKDVRYVYHASLPTDLSHYAAQIAYAGQDGLEATCELFASPSERLHLANYFEAHCLTQMEIQVVVDELFQNAPTIEADLYALSAKAHIPDQSLQILLEQLESESILTKGKSLWGAARFTPQQASREILQRFDSTHAAFLASLFRQCRRVGPGFELNIDHAVQTLSSERSRILAALNYLQEQGAIKLTFAKPKRTYLSTTEIDQSAVAGNLYCAFQSRRDSALARLNQVVTYIEQEGCRWRTLLNHFSIDLGRVCGHCGWCSGMRSGLLWPLTPKHSFAAEETMRTTFLQEYSEAFPTPHCFARYLAGTPTHRQGTQGLLKHPLFGIVAGTLPFSEIVDIAKTSMAIRSRS